MKKFMTRREGETAKKRAATFVEFALDDSERAGEIKDLNLDEWAERRGVTITNPKKRGNQMPSRTPNNEELVSRIEELEDQNGQLQADLDDANERLDSISQLASSEGDEGDNDEGEGDDEDEDE